MEVVLFILRIFLAVVFGLAAVGKFLDWEGSKKAVAGFGVPASLVALVAGVLPLIEIAIALALLFTSVSWFASLSALGLLSVFLCAMGWQMSRGNAPDCHCFGAIHSEPVGKSSIVRNVIFAVVAAVLAVSGKDGQGLDFADMTRDLAILFAVGLTVIIVLLVFVFRLQRQVKVLEGAAGVLAEVEREGVGHPDDALPIGAPAPDFSVRDLDGNLVTFESLLFRGRPLLMFFVGPTCAPCSALLPEIEDWKSEFGDKLEIVAVSSGTAEQNRSKFEAFGAGNVLLQQDREVSKVFRANWTPSAVFISEGVIASRLAVGDTQIRDLVDGLRSREIESGFTFVARGTPGRVRIGEAVEEFSSTDIDGRTIDNAFLLGKKTLVLFWSTSCQHCTAMMPEIKEWERSRSAADPELLIVTEGDPETYRALELLAPVIVEASPRSVSAKLGMHGSPSAVLIDETGTIVSESAIGTSAIWSLVGKF